MIGQICRHSASVPVGEGDDDDGDVSTFMSELEEPTLTAAVKREIPAVESADKRRSNEGQFAPIEEEEEEEKEKEKEKEEEGMLRVQGESEMEKQLKLAQ